MAKTKELQADGTKGLEVKTVNVEGENWERTISPTDYPQFHDFKKNAVFVGIYEKPYFYEDASTKIEAHQFISELGKKVLVNQAYQINKAIELHQNKKYRIEFTGQKNLDGGRKVNEYDILTQNVDKLPF